MRQIRRYNTLHATSGNTRSMSHQEIQNVRHIRQCYICLKNRVYAASDETIYRIPHREIQEVCHFRKYRMYAIWGNAIYVSEEWCIRRIRRDDILYTTSGNTRSMQQQVIQDVRHIRKYHKCVMNNICATPGETTLSMAYQYRNNPKSGYGECTPYQVILCMCETQYMSHIRIYNILYTTSVNTRRMPRHAI